MERIINWAKITEQFHLLHCIFRYDDKIRLDVQLKTLHLNAPLLCAIAIVSYES